MARRLHFKKKMDEENLRKITQLRHELHSCAELSLHESGTKEKLERFIRENTDFTVHDCGLWFWCRKDPAEPGTLPPIAFRADMDALPIDEQLDLPYASVTPGVSHKCGHDGHSAALAGLALELTGMDVERPVVLIFQHAEEIGAGGKVCAGLIDELKIGEIYAFHNLSGFPEGAVVVRRGLTQPASKGLTIHFTGAESHASYPEQGRNPAWAIADLVTFIRELLIMPHLGMTLCTIVGMSAGKGDFGVSAGEGSLSVTLRAENESEMNELEREIRGKARQLQLRDGLDVNFKSYDEFPETRNDDAALDRVVGCAGWLGDSVIYMEDLWRASEDFGWYLKKCPGAIFYVGNGKDYPPLHTAAYDFNDRILPVAVDMMKEIEAESCRI
ncbi:MAG: M20 metallopeptidase family protein [Lachnospiraceae bacterium]|jgi:amidohydrolase